MKRFSVLAAGAAIALAIAATTPLATSADQRHQEDEAQRGIVPAGERQESQDEEGKLKHYNFSREGSLKWAPGTTPGRQSC